MKFIKLFILTLFFLSLALPAKAEKQLLDRVVAVVNDDAITQSELDIVLRPLYEEMKNEFQGQELMKALADIRLKLLNQLIEDRLVFQEADKKGVQIDEAHIDERLKEFTSRFKTEQEMDEVLKAQGLALKNIRERVRRQTIVQALHDSEIRSKIVVSPLEMEAYYNEHPEEFTEEDKIKVRSMTIKKSDEARSKGLKDEEAWRKIQELRENIVSGADFSALAKQHSQDMQAADGGEGDWIERGEMIPAIDEIIFKLKVGETSEIIETSMGYHFFRVEEQQAGRKPTYDEVREGIYGYLFKKKSDKRFQEWMEELKSKAYISIR